MDAQTWALTPEEYAALSDADLRALNDAQYGTLGGHWDPPPTTGEPHGPRRLARDYMSPTTCPQCEYRLAPGQVTVETDGVVVHSACWREWTVSALDGAA